MCTIRRWRVIILLSGRVLCILWAVGGANADEPYYPGPQEARLATRSALVIGIPIYNEAIFPRLPNAARDVRRMGDVLSKLGFDVHPKYDPTPVTRQKLKTILYDYVKHMRKVGGASLIYFAGHGLAYGQQSYLVPFDAMAVYTRDLREELIPLDLVSDALKELRDVLHIVILDACRNPGLGQLPAIGGGDSVAATAGVKFKPPNNIIFATSAGDGQKARDGNAGENSPFAHALSVNIQTQNEHIDWAFGNVKRHFLNPPFNSDENPQNPTYENAGGASFFFAPTRQTFDDEKRAWDAIDHAGAHADDYRRFLNQFPAGYFSSQARALRNRAPPLEVTPQRTRLVIAGDAVKLRDAQSLNSRTIATYNTGARAEVIIATPEWTLVRFLDGNIGYVSSSLLSPARTREERVTLSYPNGSDEPPGQLKELLDGLTGLEIQQMRVTGRAEPLSQGLAAARLTKIQALLRERQINPTIINVPRPAAPDNPAQLNQVEVTATVIDPRGR